MDVMKKVLDKLEKALLILMGILLAVMVLSIFYQVLLRYVFQSANVWSEELARYTTLWITMMGACIATRRNRHIRVGFLIEKVPYKARLVLLAVVYIAMFVYVIHLFQAGIIMTSNATRQRSPAMMINMGIMYSAIIVGASLFFIFLVEDFLKTVIIPAITVWRGGGEKETKS